MLVPPHFPFSSLPPGGGSPGGLVSILLLGISVSDKLYGN